MTEVGREHEITALASTRWEKKRDLVMVGLVTSSAWTVRPYFSAATGAIRKRKEQSNKVCKRLRIAERVVGQTEPVPATSVRHFSVHFSSFAPATELHHHGLWRWILVNNRSDLCVSVDVWDNGAVDGGYDL